MIKVYTKSHCPACMMTKQILNTKNIKFEEIDAENDEALKERFRQHGFMSFPVVVMNDKLYKAFSGFQPEKLEELVRRVKIQGYDETNE